MKNILVGIVSVMSLATAAVAGVDVLPVSAGEPIQFDSGQKCVLRAKFSDAVRVRIIRGTVDDLRTMADRARTSSAACLHIPSRIVTPLHWRQLMNLNFYFDPAWLNDGHNATFVFVFEKATPEPPWAPLTRQEILNLPADIASEYFGSGVEVTVRAPLVRMTDVTSGHRSSGKNQNANSRSQSSTAADFTSQSEQPPVVAALPPCDAVSFEASKTPVARYGRTKPKPRQEVMEAP